MNHIGLQKTEQKLILIFVIGSFLFLILFEAFFIGTRLVLENQFQKEEFMNQIEEITNRRGPNIKEKHQAPPRIIGINSVVLDASGNIVDIRGNMQNDELQEFFDNTTLASMEVDTIITYDNTLFLKKENQFQDKNYTIIFFKKSGYPLEDIMRDIFRFLSIDVILILPFYFIGRYYVRRTLEPVAENIDTMSHFIHDAGHELKTPLAIISGNLQILRDSTKMDRELIEDSIKTIYSMGDSIDGLIELSNLKSPNLTEKLNLKENLEELILLQDENITKKGLKITLTIDEKTKVGMEKKHFQILFGNLISNAIRYNRDNGSIDIAIRGKKLSITDTGIGMTKEESKKIFERFYRADRSGTIPGTGIGLTLVERIVRLYDWEIEVKSEKGVGSSFVLSIK